MSDLVSEQSPSITMMPEDTASHTVLNCADLPAGALGDLLANYDLIIKPVKLTEQIPGSFWQAPEAGLVANELYLRNDTPVHSALHEACHYICMDEARRSQLHTNAGGDYDEENAVCYLQLLLANYLTGFSFTRATQDMDAWGYSFRLGSTLAWFEQDSDDARQWLLNKSLISADNTPTWQLRS